MNNQQQPYSANRFKCELKPIQTEKLKAIASEYGNTNLTHQLNIMIDSLWRALKLDKKETNGICNEK